jgi:16S rRNA G527 N7-methylase RsmG
MDRARIADLLQPFLAAPVHAPNATQDTLSAAQLDHISTYIDILLRWNARINLTAIRDPEQIVTRHFGESLFAARVLFPNPGHRQPTSRDAPNESSQSSQPTSREAAKECSPQRKLWVPEENAPEPRRGERDGTSQSQPSAETDRRLAAKDAFSVADLGSCAGFPGIPLKLWTPALHLTLIESNHKKAAFLREVVRSLTLTDIDIQNTRAETLPPASFDLVTMRAVERFDTILPTAASLIAPHGRLALLISASQLPAARSLLQNLSWPLIEPIPSSRSRILAVTRATD